MKYRRTSNDRFLLYSVGWNEKDDDGKTVPDPHTKAPDPEQGDWVWPASPAGQTGKEPATDVTSGK